MHAILDDLPYCRSMPLVLPHEICLYLHKKNKYAEYGCEAELKKFWHHFKTCTDEAIRWPSMWEDSVVPIGLHGDDCRFTDSGQKVICLSMNYLLDESQQRFPIFIIRVESQLQIPIPCS